MLEKLNYFCKICNTLKYLKAKQVYYRIYYRARKPSIRVVTFSFVSQWEWAGPCLNSQSLLGESRVVFLNKEAVITSKSDWNSSVNTKLWLYNLHYFDDLCSSGYQSREEIHYKFIDRWIVENPPCVGNGWEPYPLSLRLVNWVKWFSKKNDVHVKYLSSMAQQADALMQQLEYHILGNHLFANAKALIFVGAFLTGAAAESFLKKGLKRLDQELEEQFLPDGAHFELSPMYHCILLWDLLELIDLAKTSENIKLLARLSQWECVAHKALQWLKTMIHPDGEISFFNDAAIGIAPSPNDILNYAHKLGFVFLTAHDILTTNKASGYSRIQHGYTIIVDHANVGPDYLPGHAHADALSFELSVGNERVFVNSGTSLYGTSPERLRQRQTPAHNTVSVDGLDSSQVWSGFRVAKRAYSKLIKSSTSDGVATIEASHDGYLKQSPKVTHTRKLDCSNSSIAIYDRLSRPRRATYNLHTHPSVNVNQLSDNKLSLSLNNTILCYFESAEPIRLTDSTWHPEFGKSIPNKKIEIDFSSGHLDTKITIIESAL